MANENKIDDGGPAFARPASGYTISSQIGMSKREVYAKAAMEGMCANSGLEDFSWKAIASDSVGFADALIEALKK